MRYLLDTNIFVYLRLDPVNLSRDVAAILQDYDSELYLSTESIRELIVLYRHKNFLSKRWSSPIEMLHSIYDSDGIQLISPTKEDFETFARLEPDAGHNDPSDHIIIAQAITRNLPLISSDTRFPYYRPQGLDLIYNTK